MSTISQSPEVSPFIARGFNGIALQVEQKRDDGYINATKISNAYKLKTGKRREITSWLANKRTLETIEHLSGSTGKSVDLLTDVVDTGPNDLRGTYIHPRLAIRFGIWLSDEFGLQVEEWVSDWMVGGNNSVVTSTETKESLPWDEVLTYIQFVRELKAEGKSTTATYVAAYLRDALAASVQYHPREKKKQQN